MDFFCSQSQHCIQCNAFCASGRPVPCMAVVSLKEKGDISSKEVQTLKSGDYFCERAILSDNARAAAVTMKGMHPHRGVPDRHICCGGPGGISSCVTTSATVCSVQRARCVDISSRGVSRRGGTVSARGSPVKSVGRVGAAVSRGKLQGGRCVSEGAIPGEERQLALVKHFKSTPWGTDVCVFFSIKCVIFSKKKKKVKK
eukprot:15184_1